ncbi:selenobiotic family peptide radical SAM maturase [Thermosulfurimonas marina]|uniref:Selenobiotic family peptide radical SAM maturase n=1 Tax=Thermosulfurimonas marina TaxID=2047767 RepID=A0A6H1WSE1_9BACT|nr:thio(seleno)oxazole modification radical SAM maturase SbtM [Thermosulfurimonas marina]QJA06090.1 selenobiotic family peptide radical SAM maturase [Thermosulfurimonas marina]
MFRLASGVSLRKEGERYFLSFRDSAGRFEERPARAYELAALKLVAEGRPLREVAAEEGLPLALLKKALLAAWQEGLLEKEPSALVRQKGFEGAWFPKEEFRRAEVFTLQWHLTQRCDLSCRHCYDRSPRREPTLSEARRVLEELELFCERMRVFGQISFSGGNPFLYPHFWEVYKEAAARGFTLAILGNPVPEAELERLLALEPPAFYQVSLEGLSETNDYLRGPGHFERTLAFLKTLKAHGVSSSVMLTLHARNLSEVLPLAERLSGLAETFSFNRLALSGRGQSLLPAERKAFERFLEDYLEASGRLRHLHLKDNLFNRLLYLRGAEVCGGCTGFGCGAAFNFLALLPDGEVHACRKFPSPLGNLYREGLYQIYHSEAAQCYREGPRACRPCRLYGVCRGCLAVIATSGLNPFEDRDPFCPGPVD